MDLRKQWLPISLPPDLGPLKASTGNTSPGEGYDSYREASLARLRRHVAPVWDEFAEAAGEGGMSELAALKAFLEAMLEEQKEKRKALPMPAAAPTEEDRAQRTERYKWHEARRTANQIAFRLSVLRNVMWRSSVFGDRRKWQEVPERDARQLLTGGRPLLEEDNPSGLCDALEAALDFVEGLDSDERFPAGETMREAVEKEISRSPSAAREWMERAVGVVRDEYGANVPEPTRTTVAYYHENSGPLREGIERWRNDLVE